MTQHSNASAAAKQGPGATPKLEIHPLANEFPLMRGDEFDALVADIKAHGLRQPIMLFEGKILDGRNRYRACLAADVPVTIANGDARINDPRAYVISTNLHRRHLNREQRCELLIKIIAAAPEKSDRQIAKSIGVDSKTVGAAREKGEDVRRIPHVEKRTDTKGRRQPAKKTVVNAEEKQRQQRSKSARKGAKTRQFNALQQGKAAVAARVRQQEERAEQVKRQADELIAAIGREHARLVYEALTATNYDLYVMLECIRAELGIGE